MFVNNIVGTVVIYQHSLFHYKTKLLINNRAVKRLIATNLTQN